MTDLLDGSWQGLSGILRLGGSQTDKFSASEGERRSYECAAEAFEAVMKGTRVMPQAESHITGVRLSTAIDTARDIDENPH